MAPSGVSTDRGTTHGGRGKRLGSLRRLPLWAPLGARDFRLLWAGESISVLGDQFYLVALPWLTLQLTGSALALSTVLMAAVIPRSILILLGGALVDRSSPRLVMLGSNAIRGVLGGVLAVLVLTGHAVLWELYVLSFCFGVVSALFYPAFDSIAPLLLDAERLGPANALLQSSAQLAGLLGPVLAGLIIGAVGATTGNGAAFAVDAVSFFVATATLLLMTGGGRGAQVAGEGDGPAEGQTQGLLREIRAGMQYAWRDPILRTLLIVAMGAGFAISGPLEIGVATLAHNRFTSAAAFGIMLGAFGLGALGGTVFAGSRETLRHRGLTVIALCAGFSAGPVLIGLAPNVIVAAVVMLVLGVGNGFVGVAIIAWMQARTAADMMGRVMSLLALASVALTPVSFAVSGVVAQISVTLLFTLAGCLMGLVTLTAASSRAMRQFD